MNLITWKARAECLEGKLMGLVLEAFVQCPVCRAETTIRSSHHVPGHFSIMMGDKTRELNRQRTCFACGVVSTLPEADFERLVSQVTEKVTPAWVIEQIAPTPVGSEAPDPVG